MVVTSAKEEMASSASPLPGPLAYWPSQSKVPALNKADHLADLGYKLA